MRVIPAHNPFFGIFLVLDLVNMFPRVLREGHIPSRLRRIQPGNARANTQSVAVFFPDQHATNFRLAVRTRVLPDLAKHFALNHHSRLSLIRFPFTHFSHACKSSSLAVIPGEATKGSGLVGRNPSATPTIPVPTPRPCHQPSNKPFP